jgi:hypothetical protein
MSIKLKQLHDHIILLTGKVYVHKTQTITSRYHFTKREGLGYGPKPSLLVK